MLIFLYDIIYSYICNDIALMFDILVERLIVVYLAGSSIGIGHQISTE